MRKLSCRAQLSYIYKLVGIQQLAKSLVKTRPTVRDCVLAMHVADGQKPFLSCGYILTLRKKLEYEYHLNRRKNNSLIFSVTFLGLTQTHSSSV